MRVICRRCLLADMEDQRPLCQLMGDWLAAIPDEQRAGEALYRERLEVCRACDHLNAGLCAVCGCYVELRCAKRMQRCPDAEARW